MAKKGEVTYRIPGVITVSRATGEVTGIEMAEVNEKQYLMMCEWVLRVHGLEDLADDMKRRRTAKLAG